MQQVGSLFSNIQVQQPLFPEYNIRNNKDVVLEEIWEIISDADPKKNRRMFFIKTAKINVPDLLTFKKQSLLADNFIKSFYGKLKWKNRQIDGIITNIR